MPGHPFGRVHRRLVRDGRRGGFNVTVKRADGTTLAQLPACTIGCGACNLTLLLPEPEDLKVISSGSISNGRVAYHLSGSSAYIVEINGLAFTTTDDQISLALENGRNKVTIKTDAECQGIFEETLYLSDQAFIFPNPFTDRMQAVVDYREDEEIQVDIYNTSGTLIKSSFHTINNGLLDINTSMLARGLYIVELRGTNFYTKLCFYKNIRTNGVCFLVEHKNFKNRKGA